MIEIFKTNVEQHTDAGSIIGWLQLHLPGTRINFDLWDCDKILRVEGRDFEPQRIVALVKAKGFECSLLE